MTTLRRDLWLSDECAAACDPVCDDPACECPCHARRVYAPTLAECVVEGIAGSGPDQVGDGGGGGQAGPLAGSEIEEHDGAVVGGESGDSFSGASAESLPLLKSRLGFSHPRSGFRRRSERW